MPLSRFTNLGHNEYLWVESLREPLKDADVYVFQQRLEKIAPEMVKQAIARGKVAVCDGDDYYEGMPTWSIATRNIWNNPDLDIKSLKEQRKLADVVTVSTPFLYEKYRRDNRNCHLIRNALDWRMWEDLTPAYEVERERIRVGWVGAAAWRSGDLAELEKWFPEWIARHPEVDFVSAGTNSEVVHEGLRIPRGQRITLPYLDFKSRQHPLIVNQIDIGLVPLKMIPFNEAKSHLKGLEYNACGIPYVASPTESYRWWTRSGENGFVARNVKEWGSKLDELVADAELRNRMGRRGRELASTQTLQKRWPEWAKAWGSVTREPSVDQIARTSISYGALQKWQELSPLLSIAKGAKVIVEVGSAAGGVLWALAQVAAPDATIVSIDLPGGEHGGHWSHYLEMRGQKLVKDTQTLHLLRGDSHSEEIRNALVEILAGRVADLLFLDGDHTYSGVRADWEDYSPFAKTVAFHDICPHPEQYDTHVDQLWEELKPERQWAEFIYPSDIVGSGIGVVFQ